jgi:hypothetical protein
MGHMAATKLLSQEGRAQIHGTRGSIEAHLSKKAMSGTAGHVEVLEPTSVRRCGLKVHLI